MSVDLHILLHGFPSSKNFWVLFGVRIILLGLVLSLLSCCLVSQCFFRFSRIWQKHYSWKSPRWCFKQPRITSPFCSSLSAQCGRAPLNWDHGPFSHPHVGFRLLLTETRISFILICVSSLLNRSWLIIFNCSFRHILLRHLAGSHPWVAVNHRPQV